MNDIYAKIERFDSGEKQTLGVMQVFNGNRKIFECKTLELPWLNNRNRVSCIPTGEYEVVKRRSPNFGLSFLIKSIGKAHVSGRSFILIHAGNYYTQILGCILVGASHIDINGDKLKDVTSSKRTLKKLLEVTPDEFLLKIE